MITVPRPAFLTLVRPCRDAFARFLAFLILGISLFSSPGRAATHEDAPAPQRTEGTESVETVAPEDMQNFSITPPPGGTVKVIDEDHLEPDRAFDRRTYYYRYQQSLSPHIGILGALTDSTNDEYRVHYDLGITWELPRALSPKWEFGLDWTTLSLGQITVVRKHIFHEKRAFRPFFRYGITHKVVPDEQLATASNLENYMVRAGVGFESILRPPRSVRVDLDVAAGAEDFWVMLLYGYSWAW